MSGPGGLGEFRLIDRLTAGLPVSAAVLEGIGDDCAVLRCGDRLLIATCDASLEEVHFSRAWMTPQDIGWRAAASALSDIAAMGGKPLFVLVTLACPPDTALSFLDGLYAGLAQAVSHAGATIVGGDTTRSNGGVVLDVAVLGEATQGRPLLRRGAQAGDVVAVTGWPGASAGGLAALRRGIDAPALAAAHRHPVPRIAEGQWLACCPAVHALIDVSDGLAQDAGHIARASGLTVALESDGAPVHPQLKEKAAELGLDAVTATLTGGEAYELLFTLSADRTEEDLAAFRQAFPSLPVTVVGRCVAGDGVVTVDGRPFTRGGFDHFG